MDFFLVKQELEYALEIINNVRSSLTPGSEEFPEDVAEEDVKASRRCDEREEETITALSELEKGQCDKARTWLVSSANNLLKCIVDPNVKMRSGYKITDTEEIKSNRKGSIKELRRIITIIEELC